MHNCKMAREFSHCSDILLLTETFCRIQEMPDSDLERLLEVTLEQYNKKLTKKQLKNIVKRGSSSPLFLTAFCSDIRRAGIWEEVDLEIEKLIMASSANSVEFAELLDKKQEEYNIKLSKEDKNIIIAKGAKHFNFLTALCSKQSNAKEMIEAIDEFLSTSNDSKMSKEISYRNRECNTPVRHLLSMM